jgi:hypothetical protein
MPTACYVRDKLSNLDKFAIETWRICVMGRDARSPVRTTRPCILDESMLPNSPNAEARSCREETFGPTIEPMKRASFDPAIPNPAVSSAQAYSLRKVSVCRFIIAYQIKSSFSVFRRPMQPLIMSDFTCDFVEGRMSCTEAGGTHAG